MARVDIGAALFGQSLPGEFDGLVEQRLPQATVDRGDRHPLSEDLARGGERFAVAVLDLDGFARVNSMLGHVEGEEKMAAMSAADVFVLPSFSENFGIAAVEALTARRLTVAER